jgi:hypothetical protein
MREVITPRRGEGPEYSHIELYRAAPGELVFVVRVEGDALADITSAEMRIYTHIGATASATLAATIDGDPPEVRFTDFAALGTLARGAYWYTLIVNTTQYGSDVVLHGPLLLR